VRERCHRGGLWSTPCATDATARVHLSASAILQRDSVDNTSVCRSTAFAIATREVRCLTDPGASRVTILVCVTCGKADASAGSPCAGAALARATIAAAAADSAIRVREVECLANCSRGLSAALLCEGAWTYIFGDLTASRDAETLVTGARLLAAAPDGLLPWRGRPEPLKRGLIARVPPHSLQ